MGSLRLWIFLSILFSVVTWYFVIPKIHEKPVTIGKFTIPLLFILAFVLRIVLSTSYVGFGADFACFSAWADRMADLGPSRFYAKDYFSDYPPLYLYVLYLIGLIKKTFHVASYSATHVVLLKLPAILSDLGIGYVLYKVGTKRLGLRHGLCLASLFLFQPIVLMNSCLWGQIDSIYTLLLIMTCVFLESQNLLPAMLFFGLDVLLKPQTLVFTPVLILGIITYVFRGSFSSRMLTKAMAYGLLTVIAVLLLATPFGMENVIPQYVDTLASYPYASVNAYNFWAGIGLNWYPQTTMVGPLPCSTWGFIAIVLAASFAIILGLRLGTLYGKHYVVAAFLIITVFTFSVRMHERYLYPMIPLLLLGFTGFASRQMSAASTPSGANASDKKEGLSPVLRIGYPLVSILLTNLHFCNTAHVLFFYDPSNYDQNNPIFKIVGLGMTVGALGFYFVLLRLQTKKELATVNQSSNVREVKKALRIKDVNTRMTRLDFLLMILITLIYSVFALRDLGDKVAPQSYYHAAKSSEMTFTFPEGKEPVSFSYYIAPTHDQRYLIQCLSAEPAEEEEGSALYTLDTVFCWKKQDLLRPSAKVIMVPQDENYHILELVFQDRFGLPVLPENAADYPELFDEQELLPERTSFRNSTYFDEIYHARTAYEFLQGMRSYENTHPPFGKILISIGISLFGMTPFGWRIVGTLFGIAMLPILYLFAKKLMGSTACAALTCFIFAFDFMHFAQTRIATIDVYIVFFILCMYYFLYRFLCQDFATARLKSLLIPLGLCGISMGFGVASKWTGVYAGLGMGVLFFLHLFVVYWKKAKGTVLKSGKAFSFKALTSDPLSNKVIKVIVFCLIFFVVIPLIIYVLSYVPFRDGTEDGLLKRALHNQETMYSYHSKLEATHFFSSPFYEWPFMIKPIWYYSGVMNGGLREGISSFGNPLVWWVGIPALLYMIYLAVRKKDRRALFLVIGYFAQYLPWFFVTRLTFIYHYFPCVVFLVLMIGYGFRNLEEALPKRGFRAVVILYAAAVIGLFLYFYPILSGQPINGAFVKEHMEWFKTWYFVAG